LARQDKLREDTFGAAALASIRQAPDRAAADRGILDARDQHLCLDGEVPQVQHLHFAELGHVLAVGPDAGENSIFGVGFAEAIVATGNHEARRGKKRALEVVRHHRLIETFLYEVLDYPIEEVHEEAERLEHFISERFEERIDAKLGYPKIDPHGHCIPAMDGRMPKQNSIFLTEVVGQGTFVVESISDRDTRTLKLLKTSGIVPGVRLRVRKRSSLASYAVSLGRSSKVLNLREETANSIRVQSLGKVHVEDQPG
jgi:Iron dependent repressor, metal binding and dimerisation domain/FeoA domain